MYPRNAASPERIAVGAVVQISDGAVQTSGVSVKVMPQGGAAGAGGGTIAYEEGVVHYTPTQAETNYTSFMVLAYKTGCIPAPPVTVVTTASATPGTVLLAPVTHTSAVVPTVTTLTGHTAQTGDAFARLGAPAGASVSADVAAVKAETASILTDTAEIGAAGAGLTALATQASVNTIDDFLDTEVAAIKAKTDLIPAAPAAVGDIPTAIQNADALLNRDMATGTDSGSPTVRTVRQALRFLRNKWSISGTTLTVTKEDDATASWTSTVATTPGADPVTGNDPA